MPHAIEGQVLPCSGVAATVKDKRFAKWREHTRKVRASLGVTDSCKPWTSKVGRKLCGPNTPDRVLQVLYCAAIARLAEKTKEGVYTDIFADFYVDVSQGIQFKKWGTVQTLKTGPQAVAQCKFVVSS